MLPHIKDRSVTQFLVSAKQENLLNRCICPQFQMKIPKVHLSNQYSNFKMLLMETNTLKTKSWEASR